MKKIFLFLFFAVSISALAQKKKFHFHPSTSAKDYREGQVVVKFKPISNKSQKITFSENSSIKKINGRLKPAFNQENQGLNFRKTKNVNSSDFSRIHFVEINPTIKIEDALTTLLNDPEIEYAEPIIQNYQPLFTPNDPLLSSEYQLNNISADKAWSIQQGDPSMVIGIVDYGFDVNHEDLIGNMVPGWNVADNNTSMAGTYASHGTLSAGCASATPNNGLGIAGTGYNCKFMPIKAYSDINPSVFKGLEGLIYAVEHGCKVVNLSWGRMCGGYMQFEQDVIDYAAIENDAVVVVAAGNASVDAYWYPSAYNHVISVGYTDITDKVSSFGGSVNFGCGNFPRGTTYNDKVDIMAPGYNIFSTYPGNAYANNTGSSFAAPIVAGAAALVRVQYPSLNSQQIIDRLTSTADNIENIPGNKPYIGKMGAGRLNMYRALSDNFTAVNMTSRSITGLKNQPYLLENFTSDLKITVNNSLNAISNLQVKLSSNSPYVTISDSISILGNVGANSTINNNTDPFKIFLKQGTPFNTEIIFQLTFSNGSYVYVQNFIEMANPDYLDVNVNQNLTTATSIGRFGFKDDFNRYGKGLIYNPDNNNLLSEAGLITGTSATKISDAIHSSPGYRNKLYSIIKPLAFDNYATADFSASGIFTDTASNPNKNGLIINQHVYAWKDAPADKSVIHQFDIKNISGATITNLYAGIFADYDIDGAENNIAAWDSVHQLGVMYNNVNPIIFSGITLLTGQVPQFYAFDDFFASVNPYDGFTQSEKFSAISSGIARKYSTAGTNDASFTIAGRIDSIKNNSSQTIAFAFVSGDSPADIKAQAITAKIKFCEVNKPMVNFSIKGKHLSDTLIAGIDTVAQFTDQTINAAKWYWDFGNGKKSNLQNPTFNFGQLGTFPIKLVVENEMGCRDSLTKNLFVGTIITSTEPVVETDNILIYPNPTDGIIFINAENNFHLNTSEIIIYNALGSQVVKEKITQENNEVNLSAFGKGLYFVNILTAKKNIVKKIIIQ